MERISGLSELSGARFGPPKLSKFDKWERDRGEALRGEAFDPVGIYHIFSTRNRHVVTDFTDHNLILKIILII